MVYARSYIATVLRKLHLLGIADTTKRLWDTLRNRRLNARFRKEFPDFPLPPAALAFEAHGYVDAYKYRESGLRHAELLATIINRYKPGRPLSVLEWGCGPGRIIRHLAAALGGEVELTGTDVDRRCVEWCRAHLPGIRFLENELAPPLPFENASFDVILARSVFTHLSEPSHFAWRDELLRVLKPDGLLLITTQGYFHRTLFLTAAEQKRFDAGELVVRTGASEGHKWCSAFQPEAFMRNRMLSSLKVLEHRAGPVAPMFEQDLWVIMPS